MTKIINLSQPKIEKAKLIDVLNRLMEKTDININQLCKNTGLANTTIKRLCTEPECNPTIDSIIKIADFFAVTPNQLLGKDSLPDETNSYVPNLEKWNQVPVLDLKQAMHWPENIEEVKNQTFTQYVLTDIGINEEIFAVIASDETLEPKFSEGTVLIFNPAIEPKNKDFVILLMQDKELPQFRQILLDGPDMYSKIINPNFSENNSFLLKAGTFKILGVLIQAKTNYS